MLTLSAISRTRASNTAILFRSSAMPITTDCRVGPFNWINGRRVEPLDDIGTFDNVEPRYDIHRKSNTIQVIWLDTLTK